MLKIKKVLCPLDFSALSELELQLAADLCLSLDARMVLQHNIEAGPPVFLANTWMYSETHPLPPEGLDAEAQERISKAFSRLPPGIQAEAKITHGHLVDTILHLARALPADLIVMGTHGKSSPEHLSHTDRVLAHSPCPVLTLREHKSRAVVPDFKKKQVGVRQPVLVPLDFSGHSLRALEYALALAEVFPLGLDVLYVEPAHAWADLQGLRHVNLKEQRRRRIEHARERLEALVPASVSDNVQVQVFWGEAAREIVAYAEEIRATLIIMGTHPKNILNKLLFGKTSLGVLHRAPCPVRPSMCRHRHRIQATGGDVLNSQAPRRWSWFDHSVMSRRPGPERPIQTHWQPRPPRRHHRGGRE